MKASKKKLKNGLRYLFIPKKDVETAMVMVLVATGSNYESKKENGLAHFLEHMCFKGTEKRPTAKAISLEFDNMGASYNAFTGNAYTGYHARAHKKHASAILDIVSDVFLNSTFPQAEVEKEKGVVIQEINMYMDDPQYRVSKLSTEQLYGDQPAGREIAGTKETVSAITRDDLIRYHKTFYNAKNTIVVVAGNFNEKTMTTQLEKTFGTMASGKPSIAPKTVIDQKTPRVDIQHKDTDQTHLILSFRGLDYFDKRIDALRSLSSAFGSGMSSRLFLKMREELGICYYVYSAVDSMHDAGVFSISAGVSNDRVEEALSGIVDEIVKLKNGGITKEELKKVTECRLSGLVLHLETTEDFSYFYGRDEILMKKTSTIAERSKKIEAVKNKTISALIAEIFLKNKANLAIVGPFKEEDKVRFSKIIERIG